MAHRYRNLPVAALKALHARERGALEVFLERRGNRVRLLGRQETQLKLLLVVDEVLSPFPSGIGYFKMFFHPFPSGIGYFKMFFHAAYY